MNRQPFIIGIAAFGIISGIFSPLVLLMRLWLQNFLPAFFIDSPAMMAFIVSLFTSTIVIILAGVPAAIYERIAGLDDSNDVSLWIWVSCAALLSLPAVMNVVRIAL